MARRTLFGFDPVLHCVLLLVPTTALVPKCLCKASASCIVACIHEVVGPRSSTRKYSAAGCFFPWLMTVKYPSPTMPCFKTRVMSSNLLSTTLSLLLVSSIVREDNYAGGGGGGVGVESPSTTPGMTCARN